MLFGGASWVGLLANPEIRKVFQTLMDLSDEFMQHQAAIMEVSNLAHGPRISFFLRRPHGSGAL